MALIRVIMALRACDSAVTALSFLIFYSPFFLDILQPFFFLISSIVLIIIIIMQAISALLKLQPATALVLSSPSGG